MRLVKLELQRLPGIAPPFELARIAPGVNVVLGPNNSGKSSLARAFLALLQPGGEGNAASLAAELEDREGRLRVERRHEPRPRWRREGQPIDAPALLEPELLGGLVIRAEDLAATESAQGLGEALTPRIERELAGGFDLGRARGLEPLRERPQVGRSERGELSQARDRLQQVERKQRGLRAREESLEALRARRAELRAAQEDRAGVEQARNLLEKRREWREAQTRLDSFPPELARLPGDAKERLAEIEERLRGAAEGRTQAARALDDAQEDLQRAGLGDLSIDTERLRELAERHRELDETRSLLDRAREAERVAEAQLARVHQALGSKRAGPRHAVTADGVEAALAALEALGPPRTEVSALAAQLDALAGEDVTAERLQALRQGLEALDGWLQAPGGDGDGRDRRPLGLLVLLAVAGGSLAVAADHPLLKILALALIAAGAWLNWGARRAARTDGGARARAAFEALGLAGPAEWDESGVRALRGRTAQDLLEGERRWNDQQRRAELQRRRERLEREIEAGLAGLSALAERLGLDPRRLDGSSLRWLELLRRQDEALAALAAAEARREHLEQALEAQGRALALALAPFADLAPSERDPDVLGRLLGDLERRVRLRDDARTRAARARRDLERADADLAQTAEERANLFRMAGVPEGDSAELLRRVGRLTEFAEAEQILRDALAEVRVVTQGLRRWPELLVLVENDRQAEIEQRADELGMQAAELEELETRIIGIEKELELARSGRALEEALGRVHGAERALEERVEEQLLATAGQFLLDAVDRLHRRERTGALKRAEDWFARFTHHTFELAVAREPELRIEARDVRAGELRKLRELSTATRVQLLLAVRLAFLEEAERGREPLPLFLDEVLATSDPERSAKIIDAVAELARAGRQVFYLTAQPDEAARWRAALGEDLALHDLAAIRGSAEAADPRLLAPAPPHAVPAPGQRSPEQYAALLDVPELDPWREDATHLFHLLTDRLPLLHKAVQARYERMGPLQGLLEDPRAATVFTGGEIEELRCRLAIARALFNAWREGRGRPLDPGTLAAQDAISDHFRDQVLTLALGCELEAERLLEQLADGAVPHFRTVRREKLREWLLEEGHLVEGQPLPAAELRLRARAAAEAFPAPLRPIAPRLADVLLARLGMG